MVVFDANFLLLTLLADVAIPPDSRTSKPVERARERIDLLFADLQKRRTKIIIPTPVLAEIFVRAAAAGPAYLAKLKASAAFRIAPFDERAAIEVGLMTKAELDNSAPRDPETTYAKLKYDRQIVAIAKVERATTIYSDDKNLTKLAGRAEISVVKLEQLPLPPAEGPIQQDMFAEDRSDEKLPPIATERNANPEAATDSEVAEPAPAVQGDGQATGVRSEPGEVQELPETDSAAPAAAPEEQVEEPAAPPSSPPPASTSAPDQADPKP